MIDPQEQETLFRELDAAPDLTDEHRREIKQMVSGSGTPALEEELKEEKPEKTEKNNDDIRNRISTMKLPEKIKTAMFGNEVCRALLINDTNKMVQLFVLKNPKLQLGEVEAFAKNPNLSEQVLRQISSKKEWTKSYAVKYNLTTNPKSPPDLSLKWLRYLQEADLRKLAKSKNIPQVVSVTARKRLADEQQKK